MDVSEQGSQVSSDGVVEHPSASDFNSARVLPADRTWFQRAVFYEVLVRAFNDSNSDGSGDLRGLTNQLDYLKWLGVDCLWLPPFYDSPLRDGGYDIRNFYKVLPEFGAVEDFVALLDAAHKRGIRVITDLVMNHTSDSHPWFQESRREPDGPYGDYYVWSDTDEQYTGARIIFVDTEESNWTYDPVRRQFYWHRFFSHQPDLNYANPKVQQEMLNVLRFWLDLGIDGFRLDAVPYLFECEGTNCENLPETHEFLKQCRKVIDDEYPGRVLLAEANQWPADVVQYFGDPAGMGANIWLGDRDGVRTPMQWTPDRNAGFSSATPGRLYLPVNQDPVYGYQAINVEAQKDNPTSVLNWSRTMLAVRRRHESFAVGTFRELGGSNQSVLAYLREYKDDAVLCVNNLSRFPQPIELPLQNWAGYTPIELTGRVPFPRIGQLPYLLTLPGHGFYWFQLCGPEDDSP